MKFDVIISNPPYNGENKGTGGGSGKPIWQKFVLEAYKSLNNKGYMCFVHPDDWRKYYESPIEFSAFKGIGVSADWYLFQNGRNGNSKIFYPDGTVFNGKLVKKNYPILRIHPDCLINKIFDKVINVKDNGIILNPPGWERTSLKIEKDSKYKLAHGSRWIKNEWICSNIPHKHQFEKKVILCALREPRSKYFSEIDKIGISEGVHYFLPKTESFGKSISALINSKLIMKLRESIMDPLKISPHTPFWFWRCLNIEGIEGLTTDEEFYKHFKLTEEEIKLIEIRN
jgi:hypothetical protein